jgi:hypothetical protein
MASKLLKVAGLIGLVAALTAPLATARIPEPRPDSPSAVPSSATKSVYIDACKNGTMPGLSGGDNNNYDYYGDPCELGAPDAASGPGGGLTAIGTGAANLNDVYAVGCANGTIPGAGGGGNNDYDYYGDPCHS